MNDDVVKKLEYWAFKLCGKGKQEDAASDVMSEASKEIIKLRAERRERKRAMAHPDHQSGMVSEDMIRARMAEEIADLRAEVERLRKEMLEVAEELENEEPRSHKNIAFGIRNALEAKP